MGKYLNTYGRGSLAIAICDRCRFKFPLVDLMPDGNSPGLRVCAKCRDVFDPWRLPPRVTEKVTLRDPRPDEDLSFSTSFLLQEDGTYLFTNEGDYIDV